MDADLARLWRARLPPFHRGALLLRELEPDSVLLVLRAISKMLSVEFHDRAVLLVEDWHEHDGFLCDARSTSWGRILEMFSSLRALRKASSKDFAVRTGIYIASNDFYLRWLLSEDWLENPEREGGEVDLSGDLASSKTIESVVTQLIGTSSVIRQPASTYFDQTWGG